MLSPAVLGVYLYGKGDASIKVIALVCCGLLLTFMSRGDAQRAALAKGMFFALAPQAFVLSAGREATFQVACRVLARRLDLEPAAQPHVRF
jgi:hypothetical protein